MDAQTRDALNELLEDERASVDILVALTAMATDGLERQALTVMGGQSVQACFDLHERLEQLGAPISDRVGTALAVVLTLERLDDRYRAFADLAMRLAQRLEQLLEAELDAGTQAVLAPLRALHLAQAAWANQRADEFAASHEAEPGPAARPDERRPDERRPDERPDRPMHGEQTAVEGERLPAPAADGAQDQGTGTGAMPDAQDEIDALVEPLRLPAADGGEEMPPAPRARRGRPRWSANDLPQHDGNET